MNTEPLDLTPVLVALITVVGGALASYLTAKRKDQAFDKERKEHKSERAGWDTMNKLSNFSTFNQIREVVDRLLNPPEHLGF